MILESFLEATIIIKSQSFMVQHLIDTYHLGLVYFQSRFKKNIFLVFLDYFEELISKINFKK
jgi:hypothetical protein